MGNNTFLDGSTVRRQDGGRPAVGVPFQSVFRRSRSLTAGGCLVFATLGGCASTVDTVTGQRFRDAPFHTLFHRDDPLEVLRHGQDADLKAKAMLEIKEPRKAGRSDAEHEEVLQILAACATSDKQEICRLNAIEALSRFEDARATQYIVSAYQNAAKEIATEVAETNDGVSQASRKIRSSLGPVSTFTPDKVITIQCRALESLGKKRSPEGLDLLCTVAARPAKKETKPASLDPLEPAGLGLDSTDLRLAALRALENFQGDGRAAKTLFDIMRKDFDVALKGRAYLSLVNVTGRDWPAESTEWETMVQTTSMSNTR